MQRWIQIIKILIVSSFGLSKAFAYQNDQVLLQQLEETTHDTTKVRILVTLSQSSVIPRNEARQYAMEALALSEKNKYDFGVGLSNYALITFARTPDDIENHTTTASEIFRKHNNTFYEGQAMLSAAAQHLDVSANYIKALNYARRFLVLNEGKKDYQALARGWNLIGEVYRISKNFDKALEAYQQSARYVHMSDSSGYTSPFINIATVYKEQGKYAQALSKYDSVLRFLVAHNLARSNTTAYIMNRKAQTHLLMGSHQEALREAKEGLKLYTELNFTRGLVLSLSTLAEAYLMLGEYRNAIETGSKAIEIADRIGYTTEEFDEIHKIIASAYEALNDYKMAYVYQRKYTDVINRIYSPESYIQLANEQVKLETEKRELENRLLEKQARIDEAIIEQHKYINTFVIIVLILVVMISLYIYKNLRVKQRLNFELKEKQDEILQQSEELKAQAEELHAYNEKITSINDKLEEMVHERTSEIKKQNERLMEYAYF
ncbi:tetratricopeptide repeat protein, partial [Fulvivirga kasyanovii]